MKRKIVNFYNIAPKFGLSYSRSNCNFLISVITFCINRQYKNEYMFFERLDDASSEIY